MHQRLLVTLNISSQQLIHYYEGHISMVVARTMDGRTVRFPANILRSVVQANGVHGIFELVVDENRKFVSLQRISDV
ncbi:MAG: DUF2835 domain-containing protein [Nitrosomonas sp.]|nr:DUF2835 domain-containing protein [Nitrosomonas sp.]MCW5618025.1 DUF2835 domain-containing protein [Nitrosomonas sp.]